MKTTVGGRPYRTPTTTTRWPSAQRHPGRRLLAPPSVSLSLAPRRQSTKTRPDRIQVCPSEMKAEMDRFALDRKEMSEQMQEIKSQLEWLRSERDDEIAKLSVEKKIFQERHNFLNCNPGNAMS